MLDGIRDILAISRLPCFHFALRFLFQTRNRFVVFMLHFLSCYILLVSFNLDLVVFRYIGLISVHFLGSFFLQPAIAHHLFIVSIFVHENQLLS